MLLDGVKVVSFCHFLQGPAATQYLADMGADVIKVEPKQGAHERHWSGAGVFVGGVSGFFLCANRNKQCIAIDLKNDRGRAIAHKLVAAADVVVENFRPGVLERLGLGYEAVRRERPDIIYASASGFGASGPLSDKPGQDLLIQARSGLMAVTGNPSGLPTAVGCAVADQHGAALLAMGILGAYVRKLRTGEGSRVEASLYNAGIDLQMEALTNYLSGSVERSRVERQANLATWFHEAPYGVYRVRDGAIALSLSDPMVLADALEDESLRAFANVDRYADRDRYAAAVASVLAGYSLSGVERCLDQHGIWWAPVQDYDDLFNDPQAVHNGVFMETSVNGESAFLVAHPLRYDGEVPAVRHLATEIGNDSRNILMDLGYSGDEIDSLVTSGVVRVPESES